MSKNDYLVMCEDGKDEQAPQIVAKELLLKGWQGLRTPDLQTIAEGSDNPWYWHAWNDVLNRAYFEDENGQVWKLHQNGKIIAYNMEAKKSGRINLDELAKAVAA